MDEDDVRFIREMLYEAAVWRPKDPRPAVDVVFSNPAITRYIEGWGRPGNYGVIAESKNGAPLGAAWYRLFTQDEHGYGFISPGLPELTIGVSLSARGRGIGTMLLTALIGLFAAWTCSTSRAIWSTSSCSFANARSSRRYSQSST